MPIWLDAIGVAFIGSVTGYMLPFIVRRSLPPFTQDLNKNSIPNLVLLIASVGVTGTIGMRTATLPQGSMIGPYGLGLIIGFVFNLLVLINWVEHDSHQ